MSSTGYGISPYGDEGYGDPVPVDVPVVPGSFRSWITQKLQNYYDHKDPRVRAARYSIDAQLLNMAATELEDLELRVTRESDARTAGNCPLNVDNYGVYYAVPLPPGFQLDPSATSLNQVTGMRGQNQVYLRNMDDLLTIPSTVVFDPERSTVPFSNLNLAAFTGATDVDGSYLHIQTASPGALPIPNRLTFWLSDVGLNDAELDIFVEGETYPSAAFLSQQTTSSESLFLNHEGFVTTKFVWGNVSKITVRGLPAGALLLVWSVPFQQPAEPDQARSYIDHAYRGVELQRYWELSSDEHLLLETYEGGRDSGRWYIQSYRISGLTDIAVEPHRYGLFAVDGSNLYYANRREPLPPDLSMTALSVEPPYGAKVEYEITKPGITRYVTLSGVPYGNAGNLFKYRWRMQDPTSGQWVVTPDGVLVALDPMVGWRVGSVLPVTIPVSIIGTYVFILECVDTSSNFSWDAAPYQNLQFTPLATLSLSGITSQPLGVAYDSFGRLWIWDGENAIPVTLKYDYYIIDAANRMLYVTDDYDSVTIS